MGAYEKVTDLAYGENPHQRAAYYQQVGARMHVLSMVRQLGGKRAVVQQRARPQLGAPARPRVRGPGLRDHQAQQPVRVRRRRLAARGLRARLRVRPAVGLRRRRDRQPPGRQGVRRGARQAVLRGHLRPALHAGGARGPLLQAEHADPRGQRAPPRQRRRARPQARDGRAARAGPRHRPRGPLRDGGRHRAQAVRARVGRDAVRLEGLQARALQRDRAVARTSPPSASAPGR